MAPADSSKFPEGSRDYAVAEKTRLRRETLARRAALDSAWREQASAEIARLALDLPRIREAEKVSIYAGRGDEVKTEPLLLALIEKLGRVYVPRVVPDEPRLSLHAVDRFPEGFAPGAFGILEPRPGVFPEVAAIDDLDAIFVPGVAFARSGARIGYGKGYYDRMLAEAPGMYKAGLAFSVQLIDGFPEEPHDIRLDAVVTERGAIRIAAG